MPMTRRHVALLSEQDTACNAISHEENEIYDFPKRLGSDHTLLKCTQASNHCYLPDFALIVAQMCEEYLGVYHIPVVEDGCSLHLFEADSNEEREGLIPSSDGDGDIFKVLPPQWVIFS